MISQAQLPNLFTFAFVDPTMFLSTMTLKYGRHFDDGIIRLRDFVNDEIADLPLLEEWKSARQLLANISASMKPAFAAENLQFGRIYIDSLGPGKAVPWQSDQTDYAKDHERFRLLAAPCAAGQWFSGGDVLAPAVGNLVRFNVQVLHSLINLGPVPQISLVVDVKRPRLQ